MKISENYIKYLKNNPENYWFKRKLYGWGWTPATWQGWLITFVYVVLVVSYLSVIDQLFVDSEILFAFFVPFILLTTLFIFIACKKGEKPRWQWGLKNK